MTINGREIAKEILGELEIKVQKLKGKKITPTLAIILVGDNPESVTYVEQKEIRASKIGVDVKVFRLNKNVSENELLKKISELNINPQVHGIIVQRPVKGINSNVLNKAVLPEKDVDGFNPKSLFEPPIAKAVLVILHKVFELRSSIIELGSPGATNEQLFDAWFKSNSVVVIGKGETGGGPVIKALGKLHYSEDLIEVVDSSTYNPELITKNSDIVISAVGKPNIVRSNEVKKGAVLISIGLSQGIDGKLHGDYDEEDIKNIASFYTPTPGGVGPVNVACLLSNLVKSAEYGNR